MTADTAPRTTTPSGAPATGLFGGGKSEPTALAHPAPKGGEPSATQCKSFAQLFRADGEELHAA